MRFNLISLGLISAIFVSTAAYSAPSILPAKAQMLHEMVAPQPAHAEEAPSATATMMSTSTAVYTAPELGDPSKEDIAAMLTALGGIKGAGTMAIVILVCQILMMLMKSKLGAFSGGWQLVIVTGLSVIGTVAGYAMVNNVSIGAALVSGVGLAAIQVFGHQVLGKIGIGSAAKS